MASSSATTVSDAEKLETLRRADELRQWRSLDEERYCLVCGEVITGRQVEVASTADATGRVRLNCPTEGCLSVPMHWTRATSEILTQMQTMTAEEHKIVPFRRVTSDSTNRSSPAFDDDQRVQSSRFTDEVSVLKHLQPFD